MLLRVPYYYKEFKCIADQCQDSCCIGWEIDIDEDTYEYYKQVKGDFGKRLRESMEAGEENTFVLKNGRCPFLNDRNLCDICVELGEEALSQVCTEYPRFVTEYGNVQEKCLALSCEVVGRLVFERSTPFYYEEIEQQEYFGEEDEEEADSQMIRMMEQSRDLAIALMQRREVSMEHRIADVLHFAWQVQEQINQEDYEEIGQVIGQWKQKVQSGGKGESEQKLSEKMDFTKEAFCCLKQRLEIFTGMEVLDEEWQKARDHVKEVFFHQSPEYYGQAVKEFMDAYDRSGRLYEYEHLCVYFLFRYCMQSVYDYNFYNHAAVAAASYLMIRDMDVVRFLDRGKQFSLEDRIDVARIYSKEVEHSEENLEYLAEAFCYEEVFQRERLLEQISFLF
ncbi:MAG: flagellin lysine-N-methylase [Lachnospiraceae bacterium]|nr:flagellin lysine-N-methylase [Lachnospiraceae bacterium]